MKTFKKSLWSTFLLLLSFFGFQSCEDLGKILEDSDLNPAYFVECKLNGVSYRAQTAVVVMLISKF